MKTRKLSARCKYCGARFSYLGTPQHSRTVCNPCRDKRTSDCLYKQGVSSRRVDLQTERDEAMKATDDSPVVVDENGLTTTARDLAMRWMKQRPK